MGDEIGDDYSDNRGYKGDTRSLDYGTYVGFRVPGSGRHLQVSRIVLVRIILGFLVFWPARVFDLGEQEQKSLQALAWSILSEFVCGDVSEALPLKFCKQCPSCIQRPSTGTK